MGKTEEIEGNLQQLQELLDYCNGPVFDEATGKDWRKSIKFLLLLRESDKALEQIKADHYARKLL